MPSSEDRSPSKPTSKEKEFFTVGERVTDIAIRAGLTLPIVFTLYTIFHRFFPQETPSPTPVVLATATTPETADLQTHLEALAKAASQAKLPDNTGGAKKEIAPTPTLTPEPTSTPEPAKPKNKVDKNSNSVSDPEPSTTPTATPEATFPPTLTAEPTPTATITPIPTATPEPSPTPEPTPTPRPERTPGPFPELSADPYADFERYVSPYYHLTEHQERAMQAIQTGATLIIEGVPNGVDLSKEKNRFEVTLNVQTGLNHIDEVAKGTVVNAFHPESPLANIPSDIAGVYPPNSYIVAWPDEDLMLIHNRFDFSWMTDSAWAMLEDFTEGDMISIRAITGEVYQFRVVHTQIVDRGEGNTFYRRAVEPTTSQYGGGRVIISTCSDRGRNSKKLFVITLVPVDHEVLLNPTQHPEEFFQQP